ncbi:MAG: AAA family ATPase, partial [Thermomicrobiales bacterium]|nr:AAA family ATPase [Thermomicrobiales bacterium]
MLLDLEIRDFAIIDELRIQLGSGLNALTGETGAGKSIIIDALGAVLGERVSADMVRTGARTAYVDARFDLDGTGSSQVVSGLLDDLGIEFADGELILSREIQAGGRSTARINGRTVTAALLASLGQHLMDIHGQSDHLSLLRPAAQLAILDRYAHLDGDRTAVAELVRDWRAVRARLDAIDTGARERAQRADLLRFQVEEIAMAALQPGEDEQLDIERSRLAHAEELAQLVAQSAGLVGGQDLGDQAAADSLRTATRTLSDAAAIDASLTALSNRLLEVSVLADEIALELRDYLEQIEVNPERLSVVQERIEAIRLLKRKYGSTIDEVLAHQVTAENELAALGGSENDEVALRAKADDLEAQIRIATQRLSEARRDAAGRLSRDASQAASELNLGSMMFDIAVRPK